jgi:hypothetical protein
VIRDHRLAERLRVAEASLVRNGAAAAVEEGRQLLLHEIETHYSNR